METSTAISAFFPLKVSQLGKDCILIDQDTVSTVFLILNTATINTDFNSADLYNSNSMEVCAQRKSAKNYVIHDVMQFGEKYRKHKCISSSELNHVEQRKK